MKDCSVNFLKEGTQKLKIDFEYTDESGITYTLDTKTYSVSVSGSKPSESNSSSSNNGLKLGNRRINFFSSFFIIVIIILIVITIKNLLKSIKNEKTNRR